MALNKVILQGRLTADPELKTTPNGTSVVTFTIASDRDYASNGKREADFIRCVAWQKTAEFISTYFEKGKAILVVGRLETRSYATQSGEKRQLTEVNVNEVQFIGSKENTDQKQEIAPSETLLPVAGEDDLPF